MDRARSVVAAALGPAVVLGLAAAGVWNYQDPDAERAERNAGRVVNSRVADAGAAAAMDHLLAERTPEVVVLGPSYANTDLDPALLAQHLGVPEDEVVLLSVPNSTGAHWYAVLAHRVFGAGHRPRLVVVVSGLQSMLLTTPLSESSRLDLDTQLPDAGDPVVEALVGHHAVYGLARLREQRGKVRQRVFDALRALPAGAFGLDGRSARAALERVFDDARVDGALHTPSSVVPDEEPAYGVDLLPTPEASFLGPTTELARRHGAGVVWARPPMSPFVSPDQADDAPDGAQEAATALVEARGGQFLDLRGLPVTSRMFKNEDHMNAQGARRFTEALGRQLAALDALHSGTDPDGTGPLEATADGEGPLPPGGARTWTVTGWDERRGTLEVDVVARGGGWLRVGDERVALQQVDPRHARATLRPGPPAGPLRLTVEAPADAPTEVTALAVGRRRSRRFLVGDEALLEGGSLSPPLAPVYATPPVRPPEHDRPVLDLPDAVAAFATERWEFLSDEALQAESAAAARCSPLRVLEDGAALGPANVPCGDVRHQGHGASCHTTDRVFFTASDGSDPATNGRTYTLALDPARRCGDAAWLYPTDELGVRFAGADVATLPDGVGYVRLSARYLNRRPARLELRVLVDDEVVLTEVLDALQVDRAPVVRALPARLAPGPHPVTVELHNLDHVFYLLDEVALTERAPTRRTGD